MPDAIGVAVFAQTDVLITVHRLYAPRRQLKRRMALAAGVLRLVITKVVFLIDAAMTEIRAHALHWAKDWLAEGCFNIFWQDFLVPLDRKNISLAFSYDFGSDCFLIENTVTADRASHIDFVQKVQCIEDFHALFAG